WKRSVSSKRRALSSSFARESWGPSLRKVRRAQPQKVRKVRSRILLIVLPSVVLILIALQLTLRRYLIGRGCAPPYLRLRRPPPSPRGGPSKTEGSLKTKQPSRPKTTSSIRVSCTCPWTSSLKAL